LTLDWSEKIEIVILENEGCSWTKALAFEPE